MASGRHRDIQDRSRPAGDNLPFPTACFNCSAAFAGAVQGNTNSTPESLPASERWVSASAFQGGGRTVATAKDFKTISLESRYSGRIFTLAGWGFGNAARSTPPPNRTGIKSSAQTYGAKRLRRLLCGSCSDRPVSGYCRSGDTPLSPPANPLRPQQPKRQGETGFAPSNARAFMRSAGVVGRLRDL